MKNVASLALVALVLAAAILGCSSGASSVASLASNPLVSSLTGGIPGLSADQAIGGAGSLLGLAKENLSADQWKKVAGAVPGADQLTKAGLDMGGISGKIGGRSGLDSSFSKMGISKDQADKMVPAMSDYMTKGGNAEAADIFKGAIK